MPIGTYLKCGVIMLSAMITKLQSSLKEKHPVLWSVARAGIILVAHQFTRNRIRKILSEKRELFIELGAGDRKGRPGWVTIDISRKCDLFWDLTYGIPFPDESVSMIYSSHLFEHLTFREGQRFLDECKRVLRPGGTFSICVPNARLFIEAYLNPGSLIESCLTSATPDLKKNFVYTPAYNFTTRMDLINYTAYMNGKHHYMFDEENLLFILKAKGFTKVRLRTFNPELDLAMRDFESMYAEAEK